MSSALKRRFSFETVQPVGDVALEKRIILDEVGAMAQSAGISTPLDEDAATLLATTCHELCQGISAEGMRLAERLGIPARFIDLPYGEILAATRSGAGLRKEAAAASCASDSVLAPELLWKRVCEKTGTRDFEEFWEHDCESRGLFLSTEEFVRQVNAWCLLARGNTPAGKWRRMGAWPENPIWPGASRRPVSPMERFWWWPAASTSAPPSGG